MKKTVTLISIASTLVLASCQFGDTSRDRTMYSYHFYIVNTSNEKVAMIVEDSYIIPDTLFIKPGARYDWWDISNDNYKPTKCSYSPTPRIPFGTYDYTNVRIYFGGQSVLKYEDHGQHPHDPRNMNEYKITNTDPYGKNAIYSITNDDMGRAVNELINPTQKYAMIRLLNDSGVGVTIKTDPGVDVIFPDEIDLLDGEYFDWLRTEAFEVKPFAGKSRRSMTIEFDGAEPVHYKGVTIQDSRDPRSYANFDIDGRIYIYTLTEEDYLNALGQ